MEDEMELPPRLDPDEIVYLKDFVSKLPDDKLVVEWGSGGSTMMFLPYMTTGKFVSIEHNQEWFDKVSKALVDTDLPKACYDNFVYCYQPPSYLGVNVDIRFYGYGVPFEETTCFAASYIDPGLRYPKLFNADMYFVDGICRGAVLATIASKAVKRDAAVFIHDYYGDERREDWYKWASNLYTKVEKVGSTLARLYL